MQTYTNGMDSSSPVGVYEYVIARRDGPGGKFIYELAYDADGDSGRPHLPGLIDVGQLGTHSATTGNSRGQHTELAGRLRAVSGPDAGASRLGESPAAAGPVSQNHSAAANPRISPENAPVLSYPQPMAAV